MDQARPILIANPIYDTVFKRLMENERVARFFIGTLLEEEVVSLEMNPQEYTYRKIVDETAETFAESSGQAVGGIGFSVYRVDFIATIRTETGAWKKILIEVQKAWEQDDLMRFRNYLSEQYRKIDKVNGVETVLPVTTIYVLDFYLPEIESACIKVQREYTDMITRTPLRVKNHFVECLTHDSYVVQTRRITSDRYQTRLDKLLSVFEQSHFVGNSAMLKMYNHQPDDETVKEITEILHYVGTDPGERRELEKEQEAVRTFHALFSKQFAVIATQAKTLEEKNILIEEQEKALEEKERVIVALKKQLDSLLPPRES
ncbi:MAG: hypothetical protein LBB90_06190 [Tannerella sp.]|jgi:hypothetical protein|nr:hypothetical protein [Tannerella sp.]